MRWMKSVVNVKRRRDVLGSRELDRQKKHVEFVSLVSLVIIRLESGENPPTYSTPLRIVSSSKTSCS